MQCTENRYCTPVSSHAVDISETNISVTIFYKVKTHPFQLIIAGAFGIAAKSQRPCPVSNPLGNEVVTLTVTYSRRENNYLT